MPSHAPAAPGRALVTGATGYIGGQLVPVLLERGWTVRVLTRSRDRLPDAWADRVEAVEGDATSADTLTEALAEVDVAYYLLHSMDGHADFAGRDRELAAQFGRLARDQGVRRLVYLGGLHPAGQELSPHLASRVEVGEELLRSGVPSAVLQAAVVLGDGSVSFDMLRYLTTRLPAMIAPQWLRNRIQPIAIDDVLHYLAGAADLPDEVNRTFDVGGPEVLTYQQMIQRFARVTGLRPRLIMPVPVLTPWLASHWVGVVTPIPAGVAKPLVGSLIHEVVRLEDDLDSWTGTPPGGLTGFDDAVRQAMATAEPDPVPARERQVAVALGVAAVVGLLALLIGRGLKGRGLKGRGLNARCGR